jgi:hypothetical protein
MKGAMTDRIYDLFKKSVVVRPAQRGSISKSADRDIACYVLITCTQPNKKGLMEVDLNYEGDKVLASYLIKSAQEFFLD